MPFSVKEHDHVSVISIEGKFLGALEGPPFKEMIDELRDAGKKHLIVDLAKTDFMDSTAIGTMIGSLTTMRKVGGDIRLANLKKRIKAVFLMTKLLGGVFADYESLDEAIESYVANPPQPVPEEE